jgi:hypothetical protein
MSRGGRKWAFDVKECPVTEIRVAPVQHRFKTKAGAEQQYAQPHGFVEGFNAANSVRSPPHHRGRCMFYSLLYVRRQYHDFPWFAQIRFPFFMCAWERVLGTMTI